MRKLRIPKNLTELACEEIRSYILNGRLDDSERITEEFVSRRLGISKSPVREAFNRLEAEGLIRIEPRKGAYLRSFTAKEAFDLYDLREALEVHAVERAELTPELLSQLRESVERLQKNFEANDKQAYIKEDTEFHALLAASTGNSRLAGALENLQNQFMLLRRKSYELSSSKAVPAHRAILKALEKGDRRKAQELMRDHIRTTRQKLIEQLMLQEPVAS